MAYQDTEKSVQSAAPIEVYKFIGTYKSYFLTSHDREVTVQGQTYTPTQLTRGTLKMGTQEESQINIEISLPISEAIVFDYAYQQAPPQLTCEIIRCHADNLEDTVTLWDGRVTSFTVEGRTCKLVIPSVFSYLFQGSAPIPRFQGPCNHVFTDERCGILENTVRHTTTVNSIVGNVIGINDIPFTEDQVLSGMLRFSGSEARMITGLEGTSLTVTYPFSQLSVGDSVDIVRGCDHSLTNCKLYNNATNFGGFPLVPDYNPFIGEL